MAKKEMITCPKCGSSAVYELPITDTSKGSGSVIKRCQKCGASISIKFNLGRVVSVS